jgi:hypothetical protein
MNTTIATKPGPKCSLCVHPERQAIESALVAGEQISGDSGLCERYGLSASATHRHIALHLSPLMRSYLPADPFDLYAVAREVAHRAGEVADAAYEAGDGALTLKAGDARLRAVTGLSDRFGVVEPNAAERAETVEALTSLARAVFGVVRRDGVIGERIAQALDRAGEDELAADLRSAFPPAQKEIS